MCAKETESWARRRGPVSRDKVTLEGRMLTNELRLCSVRSSSFCSGFLRIMHSFDTLCRPLRIVFGDVDRFRNAELVLQDCFELSQASCCQRIMFYDWRRIT